MRWNDWIILLSCRALATMVWSLLLSLFFAPAPAELPHSGGKALHVPHDDVHSVATVDLPGGIRETIITTQLACRVLKTRDGGLSWTTVRGGGLELARADLVVWEPILNGGRFLIGTNIGLYSYDPLTGEVVEFNNGLGPLGNDRYITSLEVPGYGLKGPVAIATRNGEILRLNRATETWESTLVTGTPDERAQVAVLPSYDVWAPPGNHQAVAAGVAGVLYLSEDGGYNWTVNSQFNTAAVTPDDPLITAICFAEDYPTSGDITLATSVENLNNFTGDEGTLWHSGDFGGTFTPVHQANSSYRAIKSTPVGPSGKRWMMASVLEHPDLMKLAQSDGIYRSDDGGRTWDDYGSAQDFVHETDASDTVSLNRAEIIDFELSPTYATDGEILFGRSEGLFRSTNEGLQWQRIAFRPTTHVRGLDTFIDGTGALWSVSGTYGSGTVIYNHNNGMHNLLDNGPMVYQDEIFVSPRFELDGTIMVGGARGLNFWFDPNLHAPNPFSSWGWFSREKGEELGYARYLAFSPHFDNRGTAGFDQTFFFSTSTWTKSNFRSTDGGKSGELLNKMVDGSPAPWLRNLIVAPTSPGKPLCFVGMSKYPYFGVVEDTLGGPGVAYYPDGLEESAVIKLMCAPDFETNPVIYAATYTSGVKKLDFSSPTPMWESVGGEFPPLFVDALSLSPDFTNDRTIVVGTQAGVVVGYDVPGAPWELRPSRYSRDNEAPAFRYYSPNHPANPAPERVWRWGSIGTDYLRDTMPELTLRDGTIAAAGFDGDYVEFTDYAKSVQVHSFKGPEAGEIQITITNAETGALLEDTTFDMHTPNWGSQSVQFTFNDYQAVTVRVIAHLDAGEVLYFDGATFVPF